jgi:hypothetical protein
MTRFSRRVDFHALSVQDLAEARDTYHVHLANLENVVGTALGRYLIRRGDADFDDPTARARRWSSKPRTLARSDVKPWSWPCVLVFVKEWMDKAPAGPDADQVVPRFLYLPDGRQIPTCVVHTPLTVPSGEVRRLEFGSTLLGGGMPIFTEEQDRRRMGTVGMLVTDGARVYALTSRHVLGAGGTSVSQAARGELRPVGITSTLTASRRVLQELYPGLAGVRAELSLDAGLVELTTVEGWTTQILGLGMPGDLIDINVDTVALGLIGCPVRAFGAGSGELEGAVVGLFHRWRSTGGVDEIAELMIGPRTGAAGVESRPGDSGAVWVWDRAAEPDAEGGPSQRRFGSTGREVPVVRPLALQWGGQVVLDPDGGHPSDYVLASTIASVARTLGVTLLHDDSLADHSLYWGKVGHYKIAEAACHLATAGTKLADLLERNIDRIAVTDTKILAGELPTARPAGEFIALADVPDLVWRSLRQKDAPSHFADMDEAGGAAVDGKTLLQLWARGGKWRTPEGWTEFYDSLPTPPKDRHRGALPFRVAQLYTEMTGALTAKDLVRFVTAAGVLAHYIGDACQPLHVSRLHHGEADDPTDDDVHSVYESDMLDKRAAEVVTGVNTAVAGYEAGDAAGPDLFAGPRAAAAASVSLMRRSINAIAPQEIVDLYLADDGQSRANRLWQHLGPRTIDRLADGARTLAVIWQSAWNEADGEKLPASRIKAQPENALRTLYLDKTFAPNEWLKDQPPIP